MGPDLRDQFAMAALQGLLASGVKSESEPHFYIDALGSIHADMLATDAYAIADAMIKERKKR